MIHITEKWKSVLVFWLVWDLKISSNRPLLCSYFRKCSPTDKKGGNNEINYIKILKAIIRST